MFLQVQKVSGIGPKVALSLLSTLNVDRLLQAISEGDVTTLSSAPGLGKKGAQKIILELKGSLDSEILTNTDSSSVKSQQKISDTSVQSVVEGLVSLGWKQADAQRAVEHVCEKCNFSMPLSDSDMSDILRKALVSLDRGR